MERKVRFGFDIGIGSAGWAVLSYTNGKDVRIEDVGVHLFSSGEDPQTSEILNQSRRRYRGVRRLLNRRHYRKDRVKNYFVHIGLVSTQELHEVIEENGNQNIYALRYKGLTERLTPKEILNCVINICNHRGYKEFYDADEQDDDDQKKKQNIIKEGVNRFEKTYLENGYISVAEMILKDEAFKTNTAFPSFRNRENSGSYMLIMRKYLKNELENILRNQQKYYAAQLTNENINFLLNKIVFAQRDFEDGPGDKDDANRKFKGYLDNVGYCMYYKDEKRGFRSTVISDIYSLVNSLSQFTYINKTTSAVVLPPNAAKEIIRTALDQGNLTEPEVKKILKKYDTIIVKSEKLKETIPDTLKTLKMLKNMLHDAGYSWEEMISKDQFDLTKPSKLHQLCTLLSENITPHRRRRAMIKAGWNEKLQNLAKQKKFGGTASVSYKYMIEAIHAYENGETYGNFQAQKFEDISDAKAYEPRKYLLPFTLKEDEDLIKNTVVFKAVNETRKLINALVRKYGSPECINVEVANDLGRSLTERKKIIERQKQNRNAREVIIKKIVDLKIGNVKSKEDVKGVMIERYRLYEQQNHRCLYCDGVHCNNHGEIVLSQLFSHDYEVDHIIPQSLILDNSLENKALVCASCNQAKRQRTPLQFMSHDEGENFKKRVEELFRKKKISSRKYKYLMLPNLSDTEVLNEWKSRNLNDTRYLSKYIANYLRTHLLFATSKQRKVYSIKGAITSRMRRVWLNKSTWGTEVKQRDASQLHHAADAIVIANLTPAYVEIATDNLRLMRIFKAHKRRITPEYMDYLSSCVRKMKKYYGLSENYTTALLEHKERVPAFLPNIRDEVDVRLPFNNMDEAAFKRRVNDFYHEEGTFVNDVTMPIATRKAERKFKGAITDDNPIKIKEYDGQKYKVITTGIKDITLDKLSRIKTNDQELLTGINDILNKKDEKGKTYKDIGAYMKNNGIERFMLPSGRYVRKITLLDKKVDNAFVKHVTDTNETRLTVNKYYCIELYHTQEGKNKLRGIRFVDLVNKHKKIYLTADYPEDYKEHVMYFFNNDYIKVYDKNKKIKFKGFYQSSKSVNRNMLYFIFDNETVSTPVIIGQKDIVKKYEIDILGKFGGEVRRSEPLQLLKDNR